MRDRAILQDIKPNTRVPELNGRGTFPRSLAKSLLPYSKSPCYLPSICNYIGAQGRLWVVRVHHQPPSCLSQRMCCHYQFSSRKRRFFYKRPMVKQPLRGRFFETRGHRNTCKVWGGSIYVPLRHRMSTPPFGPDPELDMKGGPPARFRSGCRARRISAF